MNANPDDGSGWQPSSHERLHLRDLMLLVAGVALGIWLVLPNLRQVQDTTWGALSDRFLLCSVAVLGGLSFIGLPLILAEARRRRRPWGPGKFLWFCTSTAAWLLFPPVIYRRARGGDFDDAMTGLCFVYGTPLMALYVTLALLAGGWLRKRRRRRFAKRSWRERFGLILGLAWATVGVYLLVMFYAEDFSRR